MVWGKQILTAGILLVLLDGALLVWLESRWDLSAETLVVAQEVVLSLCFCRFFLWFRCPSSWREARRAIGTIDRKDRRLRKFPFEEEGYSHRELAFDEPEWYDLERALNKLGRISDRKRFSREKPNFGPYDRHGG